MATKTHYDNRKSGLHVRSYVRPDGSRYGAAWIWRSYWNGKARELCLGPQFAMPEAAARELVRACVTRRRAAWPFERIAEEVANFLIELADQTLAERVAESRRIDPISGALLAHKSQAQHADMRRLAGLVKVAV